MDDIVDALTEQQSELAGLLDGLDDDGWMRPSRCEGWTVKDVVLHLAQTNAMAVGSVHDRLAEVTAGMTDGLGPVTSVDDGVDAMVRRERDQPPAVVRERWQTTADEFVKLVASEDGHRRVTWVAGQLSVRTLVTTRLAETWIHTGDVAYGLDVDLEPTDRLRHIARLAWRTLPYAFTQAGRDLSGPVAFRLTGPRGDAWTFDDGDATTVITGSGVELCLVAARRAERSETSLRGDGPDATAVLELVRTYA